MTTTDTKNVAKKGRRSDAAKEQKEATRKKKPRSKQEPLFDKQLPGTKHKVLLELAEELYENEVQAKAWEDDAKATEQKVNAALNKFGITGPYRAGQFVLKPKRTQPKESCAVELVGGGEDDEPEQPA